MLLALGAVAAHRLIEPAQRLLLSLIHTLRHLYNQCNIMVASNALFLSDGTPLPFKRTLVSVWVPAFTSYSTSPSTVLMRIRYLAPPW